MLITSPRMYQWERFLQFSNLKSQISNLKSIWSGTAGFIREARKKLGMLLTSPRIYQWERFLQFSNLKSSAPGFMRGSAFFKSQISNLKSQISNLKSSAPGFMRGSAFFKSQISNQFIVLSINWKIFH